MAIYYEYIVAYDIEKNKERKRLFESLKNLGLYPVQKSVFWGKLKKAEVRMLPILFKKYCVGENDRAFFVKVDLANNITKNSVGYQMFEFEDKSCEIL